MPLSEVSSALQIYCIGVLVKRDLNQKETVVRHFILKFLTYKTKSFEFYPFIFLCVNMFKMCFFLVRQSSEGR